MSGGQEQNFSTLGPKLRGNKAQQEYGDKQRQICIEIIDYLTGIKIQLYFLFCPDENISKKKWIIHYLPGDLGKNSILWEKLCLINYFDTDLTLFISIILLGLVPPEFWS